MTGQRHATAAAGEAAIRELIARQINSWNAGGGAAYARTYTPDGDCVSFLGGHHRGRAAIAASGEAPAPERCSRSYCGESDSTSRSPTCVS